MHPCVTLNTTNTMSQRGEEVGAGGLGVFLSTEKAWEHIRACFILLVIYDLSRYCVFQVSHANANHANQLVERIVF